MPISKEACLALHDFQREAIYSELSDILGVDFVSIRPSDRLVYATDWSWMSQAWLDRGEQPPTPDFVVHPGSAAEIARVLQVAARDGPPGVPWGGGSGARGGGGARRG